MARVCSLWAEALLCFRQERLVARRARRLRGHCQRCLSRDLSPPGVDEAAQLHYEEDDYASLQFKDPIGVDYRGTEALPVKLKRDGTSFDYSKNFAEREAAPSAPTRPISVGGSSFWMPTLRLERGDTPQSIAESIDYVLSLSMGGGALKSLLTRPVVGETTLKWSVPIVLDLGAFKPDGSPHYKPPRAETLQRFVEILNNRGMHVMGVTEVPRDGSEVEKAVASLGLPFVIKAVRSGRNLAGTGAGSITMEHLLSIASFAAPSSSRNTDGAPSLATDTDSKRPNGSVLNTKSTPTVAGDDYCLKSTKDNRQTNLIVKPCGNEADEEVLPIHDSSAKVYIGNVRSGQQVAAEGGQSLVVVGSVNSGGEVLADGDVHIYGKLKGRAMAGLSGSSPDGNDRAQRGARIYAVHFDPELVCISGTYTTVDSPVDFGLEVGGSAMVSLDLETSELRFDQIFL